MLNETVSIFFLLFLQQHFYYLSLFYLKKYVSVKKKSLNTKKPSSIITSVYFTNYSYSAEMLRHCKPARMITEFQLKKGLL